MFHNSKHVTRFRNVIYLTKASSRRRNVDTLRCSRCIAVLIKEKDALLAFILEMQVCKLIVAFRKPSKDRDQDICIQKPLSQVLHL